MHATGDGEIVVLHDPTLDRTTDASGPISACTGAALARVDAGYRFTPDGGRTFPFRGQGIRVPGLVEVLAEFPDTPLNIEIKAPQPSIVERVVALVRGHSAVVVLAAEQDAIMHDIRAVAPDLPTSLAAGEVAAFIGALQSGERPVLPAGAVALQIPPQFGDVVLVTPESLAAAHDLGAEVHVWTINEPAEMRRLLGLGCDGIMSDFPARARALIDETRPRV